MCVHYITSCCLLFVYVDTQRNVHISVLLQYTHAKYVCVVCVFVVVECCTQTYSTQSDCSYGPLRLFTSALRLSLSDVRDYWVTWRLWLYHEHTKHTAKISKRSIRSDLVPFEHTFRWNQTRCKCFHTGILLTRWNSFPEDSTHTASGTLTHNDDAVCRPNVYRYGFALDQDINAQTSAIRMRRFDDTRTAQKPMAKKRDTGSSRVSRVRVGNSAKWRIKPHWDRVRPSRLVMVANTGRRRSSLARMIFAEWKRSCTAI